MVRYVLLALLLSAGAADPTGWHVAQALPASAPSMQFLGIGGYLIRWRGEGLLIAPLFSHPPLVGLPPFRVRADTARIDDMMPAAPDVTMLLIGHGHYDHLLDVPWIMQKHVPDAVAYGSTTVGHILRAAIPGCRIVDAQKVMAQVDGDQPAERGKWFYSTKRRFRAMPIESMHAPHFAGFTLADGDYHQDLNELPSAVWGWKQGQVLAWMIDLLDEQGRPVYRIHYLDSASSPPYGLPPRRSDSKKVDVQILAVSSWRRVDNYPQALLKITRPRLVLLGHWENFLKSAALPATPLPLQDLEGMLDKARTNAPGASILMPQPLDIIPLPAFEAGTPREEVSPLDIAPPANSCP